jgi:hypothetical protein
MKTRIYFNYCIEGSINLAYKDFNINTTFDYDSKNDRLYFFSKHNYYTITNASKYIHCVTFNNETFAFHLGDKILGTIPTDIDCFQFVLEKIKGD